MSDRSHIEHAREARRHYELPSYQAFLRRLGDTMDTHLRELISAAGIPENQSEVEWRIKAPASFEQKAGAADPEDPGRPQYRFPTDDIGDQLALRVIAFLPAQVEAVEQAIADDDALRVNEVRNKGDDHSDARAFGYQSVHVLVTPEPSLGAPSPPKDYRLPRIEIQLRTQLQHVWAELEHASRYKGAAGSRVSRKFDRAAALIEMVDELLQEIDDAAAGSARQEPSRRPEGLEVAAEHPRERPVGNRLTARAMRSFLAEAFPSAPPSRGAGSEEWIRRHALESGFDTVEALRDAVRSVDVGAIDRTFREGVTWERNQVRCLDDVLLAVGGAGYVTLAERLVDEGDDAQRQKRPRVLGWRLKRLREAGVVA
ncbi:GTP pyrophosphokinase [Patulibacter minatonensis]|uniref:GTP pyrophosphokinase n=1 Tax=Patulibacter minatonensis TaxID=298163 RepID=UPI00047A9D51|nr:RelA/SpoT domain-containing protein [Patulibacter minatonensis]